MRVSDLVRNYIRANVIPAYLPAVTWNEDQSPYDIENSKIIFTKQTGRAVDAYVRQADVEHNARCNRAVQYITKQILL